MAPTNVLCSATSFGKYSNVVTDIIKHKFALYYEGFLLLLHPLPRRTFLNPFHHTCSWDTRIPLRFKSLDSFFRAILSESFKLKLHRSISTSKWTWLTRLFLWLFLKLNDAMWTFGFWFTSRWEGKCYYVSGEHQMRPRFVWITLQNRIAVRGVW